jgi:putative ABC transport system permease protein
MAPPFLKTTFRNWRKNKVFSFINVIGLAAGTLCCLYILLYVEDQYSYDRQHRQVADVYRVNSDIILQEALHHSSTSSAPIAPAMRKDFPEVDQFTRLVLPASFGVNKHLLRWKERSIYEEDLDFADSTFFDVFAYHFVKGTAAAALQEPFTAVLLKSVADKLFGAEDPLGKVITIDNTYGKHDFKVTGVIDESLGKSHIHANVFVSMNSNGMGAFAYNTDRWAGENFAYSYVRLKPGASQTGLERKLPAFLQRYGAEQLKELGMHKTLHLQPVATIHTTAEYEHEPGKTVSPLFLRILLFIAVLIQLIACINFMNLSTARASRRAKEVGVRKVLGAERGQLIRQFLIESFMLSLAGVLVALPLLVLAMPWFNSFTHGDISLSLLADYRIWMIFSGLILVTALIAGSYPAFYLSAFSAIKVLKGNFTNHISAAGIRRSLVVFQFVITIALITGIIVIYSQLQYIGHKDLGFDRDQQLVFHFNTEDARSRIRPFMDDLSQLSEVKESSNSSFYLSQFVPNDWPFFPPGGSVATAQDVTFIVCDEYFVKANGIRLSGGRDFRLHDSDRVLINETLARRLGFDSATAPGKKLYAKGSETPVEIVGVMKDFNYNSLHDLIQPFMLRYGPNGLRGWGMKLSSLTVRASTADYTRLLEKIQKLWSKDLPSEPFSYVFLSDEVQQQYETETTMSRIINTFTGMAILISCLGLFGLAAFSAEQRTKEIGVRKVLGASEAGIVALLSADFMKLVGIAFVIATPIAWWAMSKWLQVFAYRISITWWMLAAPGLIALVICLVTVGFQALKAAVANPVKSLRSE